MSLVEFNPINPKDTKRGWKLNNRDHRKLLIIDGKRVFLGGINSSVYWEKQSGGTLPTANYFPALVSQGTAWYTQSEALLILRNRSK